MDRAVLTPEERHAVKCALEKLLDEHGSQTAVAKAIGKSQSAVSHAVLHDKIGPELALAVTAHLRVSLAELVVRHPLPPPSTPNFERALAYMRERETFGEDKEKRARRHIVPGQPDFSFGTWLAVLHDILGS